MDIVGWIPTLTTYLRQHCIYNTFTLLYTILKQAIVVELLLKTVILSSEGI